MIFVINFLVVFHFPLKSCTPTTYGFMCSHSGTQINRPTPNQGKKRTSSCALHTRNNNTLGIRAGIIYYTIRFVGLSTSDTLCFSLLSCDYLHTALCPAAVQQITIGRPGNTSVKTYCNTGILRVQYTLYYIIQVP